jgi:hypothetical protein
MVEQGQGDPETSEIEESRASARPARGSNAEPAVPKGKVGMLSAARLATRPVHYIDDFKYAPTLIFRTHAIWPTVLISLAGLAFGLTQNDFKGSGFQLVLTFWLSVPALLQPMVAGFFAPRATWLAGIISSVISSLCYTVLVVWATSVNLANLPANYHVESSQFFTAAVQFAVIAFPFGALLGAASGWYKRFLTLGGIGTPRTAPNKQKRQSGRQAAARRPSARR